jgi:hypothetical protein
MTDANPTNVAIGKVPDDLGKYVVPRERSDGTFRVMFEVPKRLRPENWPATIPLPYEGRTGDLGDAAECERIRTDARELLSELNEKRAGLDGQQPQPKTWETLFGLWHRSARFGRTSRVTQESYLSRSRSLLNKVLPQFPSFAPDVLTESQAEEILASVQSPDVRRIYLSIFKLVMNKAIREKWREDNPFAEIKYLAPDRTITLWDEDDVRTMTEACVEAGQPSVAGIIWTAWEIGQRLTDIRMFRHGVEYVDGVFRFFQSKTGQYVTIPAPDRLRDLIDEGGEPGGYLFLNAETARPFTMQNLSVAFKKIRKPLQAQLGKRLLMQKLRHSSVYQFALAECSDFEIASVTGHSYQTVHTIIEYYLPRDNALAFNAMKKRAALNSGRKISYDGPPRMPLRAGLRTKEFA